MKTNFFIQCGWFDLTASDRWKYIYFNIETELFAGITIGCGICSPTSEVQHPANRFAAGHFPYVKPFTCESREELAAEAGHFPSFYYSLCFSFFDIFNYVIFFSFSFDACILLCPSDCFIFIYGDFNHFLYFFSETFILN